ncbi:MAG: DUF3566 domain-containing protein [Microthrixaceae bacterium]
MSQGSTRKEAANTESTATVTVVDATTASELATGAPGRSSTIVRRRPFGRSQRFEARRVRRVLRHIDPWSVLKVALVFFVCMWLMSLIASAIVWAIATGSGTVEKVESFVRTLWGPNWRLNGRFIFRQVGLFGIVMVFASTLVSVVATVAFNLISDLVGGVWFSVIEEETSREVS